MAVKVATSNNEIVNGTEDADELYSGGFNNVTLNGLGEDDRIYANDGIGGEFNGGGGNDFLSGFPLDPDRFPNVGGVFNGGDGDDIVTGTSGTFNGGNGNDDIGTSSTTTAILNGDDGDDQLDVSSESGTFQINGGSGYDVLNISEVNFQKLDIVRYGDQVFLSYYGYKATITGVEYFRFYDVDAEGSKWKEFTLETLGSHPDRVAAVAATGDDYIDGLIDGEKWIGGITYSFGIYVDDQQRVLASALLRGPLVREYYDQTEVNYGVYGSVTSLVAASITRSPSVGHDEDANFYANDGDIKFQNASGFEPSYVAYPPSIGSITFNSSLNGTDDDLRYPSVGSYAYLVYLQGVGRALGLKSASEAGGVADVAVPADKDSLEYTVMSARSYPGGPAGDYTNGEWDFPQTFMALDIQALQKLYGVDYTTNAINTTYKWDSTGAMFVNGVRVMAAGQYVDQHLRASIHPGADTIFLTVWDGGGHDTYDFSNYTDNMTIDLSPGGASLFSQAQRASLGDGVMARGNVYNSYLYNDNPRALIENAIGGSGNDTLRGNIANNVLNGSAGADTMTGLAGNDSYVVDNLGDVVVEAAGEGTDLVYVRVSGYVLTANVENAQAEDGYGKIEIRGNALANIMTGNQDKNALYGNAGADTLYGNAGNDHLDGGTGADAMVGGSGYDTYIVDNYSDVVYEKPGEGIDTLWTSVSRGLDADFENIVLFGTATDAGGNGKDNTVAGNELNNNLYGGGGSDSLYGHVGSDRLFGEDGNDYMTGGTGRDAYYGGAGYDYAILEKGGGVDYFVDWKVSEDRVVFDSDIFPSIGAVLTAAFQNGTDVVIWDGHDGIVLQNAKLTELTTSNFLFT
ncbi:M10 family metallopeptidase C-terminal domain-containing protein [Ancylobacter sonchi]|uniref:M10 family metallopeptidase C-terminal domain-containing protein n=1 Tax=Ancylobacter sonchi TaxID=1937790 RepID=UPI001BD5718C|nr:M10 family metallopeptidase C-terminal domain-containing protein [Ancylobacter sonchi]MBS7532507.1 M10 family metallopeptidase C-terminal domain-containing protein [Ancylobacter sonchi]